ncbi:hypothetical protein BKA56DRAFT_624949 [Ilyonectria sp. MPI-CAGE-AT-0026]|nr:hypothetical protein BKA56DRAFT_624949 [Ilyonectria sp. MPI-CAGE-AT-0026]
MTQVVFSTNNTTISLDSTVASVDLGFPQAYSLSNNDTESVAPLTGTATSITVTYLNNIPEPVTYNLTQGVNFTPNATVTIQDGGASGNSIIGLDDQNKKAIWTKP